MWQSWVDLKSSRDTVATVSSYYNPACCFLTLPVQELVRMQCLRLAADRVLPPVLLRVVSVKICMHEIYLQALGRLWNEVASSGLESWFFSALGSY
jgi:hypothetical protein